MTPPQSPVVRRASREDAPVLFALVEALARYEKLAPPDAAAKDRLAQDLFGPRPRIEAYLGEFDGRAVAYAITFESYSSFLALPTLYLEDIFVLPEYRSKRVGIALFKFLVSEALNRGCGRMEWSVLDWNQLAIDFYKRIGARHMKEWHLYRMVRSEMQEFLNSRR